MRLPAASPTASLPQLQTSPPAEAPPAQHIPASTPLLRVLQGEVATVDTSTLPSPPPLLASSAATTCIIIAVHLPPSHAVFAHVDSPETLADLFLRLSSLAASLIPSVPSPRPASAWILGASPPAACASQDLLAALPSALASALPHVSVAVRSAWVGAENTTAAGAPRHTALVYDPRAQTAAPARIETPARAVPHAARRAALMLVKSLVEDWSPPLEEVHGGGGRLRLRAFRAVAGEAVRAWLASLVALDDTALLAVASTSPECEEPGFAIGVREYARWVLSRKEGELVPEVWC